MGLASNGGAYTGYFKDGPGSRGHEPPLPARAHGIHHVSAASSDIDVVMAHACDLGAIKYAYRFNKIASHQSIGNRHWHGHKPSMTKPEEVVDILLP
jgi:hypothetical protein